MKFLLTLFTIITLAVYPISCTSDDEQLSTEKLTLNQIYNELRENSSKGGLIQGLLKFTKVQNYDCIKEKLKISQVGQKEIPSIEAQFLTSKAIIACSGHSENELLKSILSQFSKNHQIQMTDEDLLCTKFILQKLDPSSKFVENFNQNVMTAADKESCKERVRTDRSGLDEELRKIGNEEFSTFTCERLNSDEIYKYMCTFGLITDEIDTELKDSEMDILVEDAVKKIEEIFECRMNKLIIEN